MWICVTVGLLFFPRVGFLKGWVTRGPDAPDMGTYRSLYIGRDVSALFRGDVQDGSIASCEVETIQERWSANSD